MLYRQKNAVEREMTWELADIFIKGMFVVALAWVVAIAMEGGQEK